MSDSSKETLSELADDYFSRFNNWPKSANLLTKTKCRSHMVTKAVKHFLRKQ